MNMKKIALGVGIAASAILVFLYIQLQLAQNLITERLAQQGVTMQSVNLSLFPPALSMNELRTSQFSIQHIEGRLNFLPLIYGDAELSSLELQKVKLSNNAQNSANIAIRFSPFSLKQLLTKKVNLKGENHISVELAKPLYGKNKIFYFAFNQANIDFSTPKSILIQFVDASLNKQSLGYIETHANFATPLKQLMAYIKPECDNNCLAILKYEQSGTQSAVNFSGKYFPIKRLLTLLNFPETLSGHTDFNIHLAINNSELVQGKFNFHAKNGEIIGMNLLDIVAQYFPINYNNELLQNKDLSTRFDVFDVQLSLQQHQLHAEKIELKTPALFGLGNGIIDLNHMQCDVSLTLRSTDERYQNLALPIRFFGNCYSPQYKFSFTKEFRRQLIDVIKEKLR